MRSIITKFAIAAGTAALLAVSSYAPAQAGGKEAGAFLGGLLLGGAIANAPYHRAPPGPGYYVAPAPVYVQPSCWWQIRRVYDPYSGYYVNRRVRVCR